MSPDPDLGSQMPLRKTAFFIVLQEVVGIALVFLGSAFIKSERTMAVLLTIGVGAGLIALGIIYGWKNRRGSHE